MLTPPSLSRSFYYPITSSICLAAIAAWLLKWSGQSIDELTMNVDVWDKWQLWRAAACVLPHANFLHLAFNLYWVWTFGTLVEKVFGHLRCAAIFLLLAVVPSLAEFTFLSGGIGLSGVGYGLWGLIWVMEQRDVRFVDAVDRPTSQMFIGWFFLCILLTATGIMRVANIEHGVGALTGALLGYVIASRAQTRWLSLAALSAVTALTLLGALKFWPWLNLSPSIETEVELVGINDLEQGHGAHAVKVLQIATQLRHAPASAWYNLGVACQRTGRPLEAVAAFQHAGTLPDADSDMQRLASELNDRTDKTVTNR